MKPIIAHDLRPGVLLPPPQLPAVGEHRVTEICERDPETGVTYRTDFTRDDGLPWHDNWNDHVLFPRRSTTVDPVDWRDRGNEPPMRDIFAGDILPTNEYVMSVTVDMRRVILIRAFKLLDIKTAATTRIMQYEDATGILLGVTDPEPLGRRVPVVKAHGPYVNDESGTTHLFLIHPYGRGRWPRGSRLYEETVNNPITDPAVSRPPSTLYQWAHLRYDGPAGERHPKDPLNR